MIYLCAILCILNVVGYIQLAPSTNPILTQPECKAPNGMVMVDCPQSNAMCHFECQNKSLHVRGGEARSFCVPTDDRYIPKRTCEILYDVPCSNWTLPSYIKSLKEPGPYKILNIYEFECHNGWSVELGYRNIIACEPGGIWGDIPKCVPQCKLEGLKKFGLKVRTDKGHCWKLPGSYCPVTCEDTEKELEGEITLYCKQDGTWSAPKIGCVPKVDVRGFEERCGPLPDYLESILVEGDYPDSPERVVRCVEKDKILCTPDLVKCMRNNEYSKLPACHLRKYFDKGEHFRGRQCKYQSLSKRAKFLNDPVNCLGMVSPVGSLCILQDPTICKKHMPLLCMKNLEWSKPTCKPQEYYPEQP